MRSENNRGIEILAAGQAPVTLKTGVAVYADQLNAFGAARMTIGGGMTSGGEVGGNTVHFGLDVSSSVTLRSGAVLSAAEVFLIASQASFLAPGSITIEQGASINTLGRGAVTLSPVVPSSGAGIATLNPIPEVPAGDIDLIAPVGTIDAGEAGIRVSGNVNLAALQVLNAANIQVQGTATGIPTVQAPSISAALSTSNATAATQQTAAPAQAANVQPSVIIVEVLGYGGGSGDSEGDKKRERDERQGALVSPIRTAYNERSAVQIAGYGVLTEAEARMLTEEER